MNTTQRSQERPRTAARRRAGAPAPRATATTLAFALTLVSGCANREPDPAMMDSLAEMEIRIRLLQSELTDVRQALTESETQGQRHAESETALQLRLENLGASIAALPETLKELCPVAQAPAAVSASCEPEIQRVMASGDKLVVGELERVWLDPPAAFMMSRIDAVAEYSFLHAEEVVEFERDGNKWVRFGVMVEEETVSVERPLKRFVRARNERRAIVDLRVQIGDVRETVEFALGDLSGQDQPVALGRNFLTDVALLDISRRNVQPALQAPNGSGL